MTATAVIIIILLVLNFIFDIAYVHAKNKYIKVMEQQNTILWAVVEQSKNLMAEAIKESEKVNAKTEEVKITLDGKELEGVVGVKKSTIT